MKAVIHQPEFLPWLGFFDKLYSCDLLVILDHVQYQRGFINRNKVKNPDGWQWLTVPIEHKFHRAPINQVLIKNSENWSDNIIRALKSNYGKSPYFSQYFDFFEATFSQKWESLSDLNIYLIEWLISNLNINIELVRSSELNVNRKSTELLVETCQKVNADHYLSGQGGKNYMEMNKFDEAGIKVSFQDYQHPEYVQQFKQTEFQPHMSVVDLIFNCGTESQQII